MRLHWIKKLLYLLVALALIYSFLNGSRDSSSILAGVIASRAMRPRVAVYLVVVAELIAPFFLVAAVARSFTTGLVNSTLISINTIVIAMVSAVLWNLFYWWRAIPSSSRHALIGGVVGAALIIHGPQAILFSGLLFILIPLLLSPIIGLVFGFLLMRLLLSALRNATPRINSLLRNLQVDTAVLLAMSNSAKDSHKSMGIIVLGLILAGKMTSFTVPLWTLVAGATALALGASRGDWRKSATWAVMFIGFAR